MTGKPETGVPRVQPLTFRLTDAEARRLKEQALMRRFSTNSAYLRWLVKNDAEPARESRIK